MIGQRIENRPGSPGCAGLMFVIAAGFVAWAIGIFSPHPALAAILPAFVGLALLLAQPRRFAATLTETGVELADRPEVIPYAAIDGLTVAGGATQSQTPLYIFHANGVVAVPPRLNVPTNELFSFLASRVAESGSREVPAPLLKYLNRQIETFGDAKVFSFRARPHATPVPRRRAVAVCLALTATGLIWIVVAIAAGKDYLPWGVVGGWFVFIFGLCALGFGLGQRRGSIKNWRQSGLVIGPAGLALVQGDMKGELRWDELRKVEYRDKPRSFRYEGIGSGGRGPDRGIHLVVEGARIVIADIYDRPLPLVFDRIRAYWRRPED
jgi:hypothetical protein